MRFLGEDILLEEKLNAAKRNSLDASQFGLPKQRKYPLNDANHVRSAMRYFDKCPDNLKPELARNIKKAAKKYGVEIDKDSKINSYTETSQYPYQEAPNNNQQQQNNNNAQAADADDAPADYADAAGAGAPTDNVTDAGSPDYTGEEQPEEDEGDQQQGADTTADAGQDTDPNAQNINLDGQAPENTDTTDANDPNAANPEDNNTNTDVNPDANTPGDTADPNAGADTPDGGEDTATDYTTDEAPSGDDAEGDDGTGGEGQEDPNAAGDAGADDMGAGDAGGASGLDAELQQLQQDVFSNLTDQQMQLRINDVKDSYIELYNNIANTAKRLVDVNRSSSNISTINFLNETLNSLRGMVRDALTDSFNTKSLAENEMILQKFISIYSMILKIVERLANKEEKDDKKNKEDENNEEDSFSSDMDEGQ